jgi:hypothetical protein
MEDCGILELAFKYVNITQHKAIINQSLQLLNQLMLFDNNFVIEKFLKLVTADSFDFLSVL